jgi:uncharacterized membrane protein
MRRYLHASGRTAEECAEVAAVNRSYARANPRASFADVADASPLFDPLTREQAAQSSDGCVVIVLRGGVLFAGGLLAMGLVLHFLAGGNPLDQETHLPSAIHGLASITAGNPMALLADGLFLLICLPVARVVLSLVHFARERDHRYVLLTSAVLAVLAVGIVWGKAL